MTTYVFLLILNIGASGTQTWSVTPMESVLQCEKARMVILEELDNKYVQDTKESGRIPAIIKCKEVT